MKLENLEVPLFLIADSVVGFVFPHKHRNMEPNSHFGVGKTRCREVLKNFNFL